MVQALRLSHDWHCARTSLKLGSESGNCGMFVRGLLPQKRANRSGCGNGSGRNSVALTTLKIAVFAPIPSASIITASAVKPGFFHNIRAPYRRSCSSVCIIPPQPGFRCQVSGVSKRMTTQIPT
jgi:hypothetical protein